jgi:hypothetical protein
VGIAVDGVEIVRISSAGLASTFFSGNGSQLTGLNPVSVSNIQITDSGFMPIDDTAISNSGGYLVVNGTGFREPLGMLLGASIAPTSVTVVSQNQARVQVPSMPNGTYPLWVFTDTSSTIKNAALQVSPVPIWSTSTTLANVSKFTAFTQSLVATEPLGSNITYTLASGSSLPANVTLTSNGVLAGNILTDPGNSTTYNFAIDATDTQFQNIPRTFTLLAKKRVIQTQIAKLLASDGTASDYFGYSVAISADGTTAIVGAYGKSLVGAVYVFKTTNGTTWTQIAKLTASDGAANDYFGYSVAISADGSTAIVGAHGKTSSYGAAYIFKTTNGTTWTQIAKLLPGGYYATRAQVGFGYSVAMSWDGRTVVIGAPYANYLFAGSAEGAAYIFTTSDGTTWTDLAAGGSWPALGTRMPSISWYDVYVRDGGVSNITQNSYLGNSVAISSDGLTVIVGAYLWSSGKGAAYIFKTTTGSIYYTLTATLLASDGAANDNFGTSVSISPDGLTTIVGSPYNDSGGLTNNGAAYVFKTTNGTTWTQIAKLTAFDGATNDNFGSSVTITTDMAIVGANRVYAYKGAAYIFDTANWTQIASKLTASDGASDDYFGSSVASDGRTAIVGAYYKTSGNVAYTGAAYIFS